jgi:hypothetical protein
VLTALGVSCPKRTFEIVSGPIAMRSKTSG